MAMDDKEAYEGLQKLANEKYWPLFFRKMMFTTSLFFLLLSPYMLLASFFHRARSLFHHSFHCRSIFHGEIGA
ncbi:hypothetical protein [Archaeoglobus sp.]